MIRRTTTNALLEAVDLGLLLPRHVSWTFRNVSLTLRPLASIGIFGPSGSGKSLLLKTLATLMKPTEGEIRFGGKSVAAYQVTELRVRMQYLPQQVALLNTTVEQNLIFPWTFKANKHSCFNRLRVVQMLSSLGRDNGFMDKGASELSVGEQQAVGLVRALQLDPEVLLMDEATASMDPELTLLANQLISEWQVRSHGGVIRVSHQRELLGAICDRVLEFGAGSSLLAMTGDVNEW